MAMASASVRITGHRTSSRLERNCARDPLHKLPALHRVGLGKAGAPHQSDKRGSSLCRHRHKDDYADFAFCSRRSNRRPITSESVKVPSFSTTAAQDRLDHTRGRVAGSAAAYQVEPVRRRRRTSGIGGDPQEAGLDRDKDQGRHSDLQLYARSCRDRRTAAARPGRISSRDRTRHRYLARA